MSSCVEPIENVHLLELPFYRFNYNWKQIKYLFYLKLILYFLFSVQAPPTILYHVVSGDAGLAENGSIVVFPGTIINIDCLYQRQLGNPLWEWTPSQRFRFFQQKLFQVFSLTKVKLYSAIPNPPKYNKISKNYLLLACHKLVICLRML